MSQPVNEVAELVVFILLALGAWGLGWIIYTFIEYWAHRSMHILGVQDHIDHHKDVEVGNTLPLDCIALAIVLIASGAVGSLGQEWWWLAAGPAGSGYGYYRFRQIHTNMHRTDISLQWLFRYAEQLVHHAIHHNVDDGCNFGVTTTFWDRVFRTLNTAEE